MKPPHHVKLGVSTERIQLTAVSEEIETWRGEARRLGLTLTEYLRQGAREKAAKAPGLAKTQGTTSRTSPDALVNQAELYLSGEARLFGIEWAVAAGRHLKGTSIGAELDAWLVSAETELGEDIVRRAVDALRKAAA